MDSSEQVSQLKLQQKILSSFPELWAIVDLWPILKLQICNDSRKAFEFLSRSCSVCSQDFQVWIRVETEQESAMRNISGLVEQFPPNHSIARMIRAYHRGEGIQYVIVWQPRDGKLTLFRVKRLGVSLGRVIDLVIG